MVVHVCEKKTFVIKIPLPTSPWSTAWCIDAWKSCSWVKHSGKVLAIIKEIIPFCGSSRLNLKPYVTCLSPVGAGKKQHSKHFFHPTRLGVVMRNRQSSNNTSKKSVIKRQSWVGAEGSCARAEKEAEEWWTKVQHIFFSTTPIYGEKLLKRSSRSGAVWCDSRGAEFPGSQLFSRELLTHSGKLN